MLFLVSIEPIFSQPVGDYIYLCDSIDKVEYFRSIHRELARHRLNLEAYEGITVVKTLNGSSMRAYM